MIDTNFPKGLLDGFERIRYPKPQLLLRTYGPLGKGNKVTSPENIDAINANFMTMAAERGINYDESMYIPKDKVIEDGIHYKPEIYKELISSYCDKFCW